MASDSNLKQVISGSESISFPEFNLEDIPARIDTGARTSSLWASQIREHGESLSFVLFGKGSPYYTGEALSSDHFELREVTSSNGITEERYMVKVLVILNGRRIRARFTLANRSTQKYPVLVGRNILRGKFIVDVKLKSAKAT